MPSLAAEGVGRPRRLPAVGARAMLVAAACMFILLTASFLWLAVTVGDPKIYSYGGVPAVALVCFVTGGAIARRRPDNPISWVLLTAGVGTIFLAFGSLYEVAAFGPHPMHLPAARADVFLVNATWEQGFLLVGLALALFPDGELTSRRSRLALRAYLVACLLVVASQAAPGAFEATDPHLRINLASNPVHLPPAPAVMRFMGSGAPLLLVAPFWVAWLVALLRRYRGSAGDRRQQLKWLSFGAGVALVASLISTTAGAFGLSGGDALSAAAIYAILALPVSMGVAVLRYRLYDIDRVVSRTIAYLLVTGSVVGLYVGLVTLTTRSLGASSPVAVAASTLVAAA